MLASLLLLHLTASISSRLRLPAKNGASDDESLMPILKKTPRDEFQARQADAYFEGK